MLTFYYVMTLHFWAGVLKVKRNLTDSVTGFIPISWMVLQLIRSTYGSNFIFQEKKKTFQIWKMITVYFFKRVVHANRWHCYHNPILGNATVFEEMSVTEVEIFAFGKTEPHKPLLLLTIAMNLSTLWLFSRKNFH